MFDPNENEESDYNYWDDFTNSDIDELELMEEYYGEEEKVEY